MANLWEDGDWTVASAVSGIRKSSPIPGVATAYVLEQDFMQFAANFSPVAIGTAHPTETGFVLVAESDRQPLDGGVVRWTRTYAAKPAQHNEYETYAYTYIGFWSKSGNTIGVYDAAGQVMGRERFTKTAMSRVQHDYYIVGGGGSEPATVGAITLIQAQTYYQGAAGAYEMVNFIWDAADGFSVATTPTKTAYKALVAAGTEIVVETSTVERWMGNIFVRKTRFTPAL